MNKIALDLQLTGMAGEFLTAGKLFKRGYQVSITLGNAKAVDLFVYNPQKQKTFNVQVKTLRKQNCFLINKNSISHEHIYVFIVLNAFDKPEDFYILLGEEILNNIDHFFGSSYRNRNAPSKMPAINYGPLKTYKDNWSVFD
jgi:hypothetical protein